MRHILRESTAIGMNRSFRLVGIIDMLVFVDDRVEAVVFATVIGKIKVRFLYEIRVFWGDDAAVKNAVRNGAVNEAVLVAENLSFVNMTRV